ncbi:winged helix-turn-helix domain-containing protein [Aliiglaciecola sp. CAU 1673]|uniref:winged helix-turn-helix domain-containing protein n=1 Tax=Aliiglaciecola sp. CAU 1673 TaxID=3032595 RepID=UPI0023DC3706|nr:winged helix-turn-helix domain-containing protein [Aliiglaciecola sp. CAU 1673]MDF2178919.1 winged helix-turn-helix domain-containing protein [Aliiglaciecola sp. CAU 1673]
MNFTFDHFEVDTANYQLRCKGEPLAIEPQVFNLLAYLLRHRDRIVSKSELMDNLWAGKVISDSTLSSCVKAARKAIGDGGKAQKYIATINRRGFRFIFDVNESGAAEIDPQTGSAGIDEQLRQSAIAGSQEGGSVCLFPIRDMTPDKRIVVAVLPFQCTGSDLIAFFAETLYEDINIHLARTPGFLVTSRNTGAYYRANPSSHSSIAQELGAQYVVDGTVRCLGEQVNLSIKLVEATNERVLWGVRKNVPIGNLTEQLEDITLNITSAIEPEINRVEFATLRKRRQVDLGAWELYRQGHAVLGLKGWSEESFQECADLLRQAISKDPELAFAHAYLALTLAIGHLVGLVNHDGWHEEAMAAAETAIALDSQDPDVLGYVGCAFADMGDFFRGIKLLERCVELDPSNAQGWAALGAAQLQIGQEQGFANMYHGIRISPRDNRIGAWGALLARALLSYGRLDEAIEVAQNACAFDDKIFLPRIVLGIALALADQPEAAATAIEDARRIRPKLTLDDIKRFVRPEEVQKMQQYALFG